MRKKLLSVLITAVMLVQMIGVGGVAYADDAPTTTWQDNGVVDTVASWSGAGTSGNPYKISTAGQLAYIANQVNALKTFYKDTYFVLTGDIDLADHLWIPIGVDTRFARFDGHFNGQGHTVSGMTLRGRQNFTGLFGEIGAIGSVERVALINPDIIVPGASSGILGTGVGGIAGSNTGTIENCLVRGTKTISGGWNVGGIAGYNSWGTIRNCVVDNPVSCSHNYVGGITGSNDVSSGGGVGDKTSSDVIDCLSLQAASGPYTGAIVGKYGQYPSTDREASVSYCHYTDNGALYALGGTTPDTNNNSHLGSYTGSAAGGSWEYDNGFFQNTTYWSQSWNIGGDDSVWTTDSGSKSIYLQPITYTVTWKSQDGATTLETDTGLHYGATPSFGGEAPTKASDEQYDYTFVGWATSANQTNGTEAYKLAVTDNVAYYVAFGKVARTYKIIYDANGGTVSSASTPIKYINQGLLVPTRTGYAFDGWYDGIGGTGNMVTNGGGVPFGTVTGYVTDGQWNLTTDKTVYAHWTVKTYTIYLSSTGGTGSPSQTSVTYDSTTSLPVPTRAGYTFDGWYDGYDANNKNGMGNQVTDNTGAPTGTVPVYVTNGKWSLTTINKRVYAKWTANTLSYTITWKSQDGGTTLETDNAVDSGQAPIFNGTAPTKASDAQYDYTFVGWATSANQTSGTTAASLPTVSGAATYYAAFSATPITYTVTWKSQDGSSTLEMDTGVAYNAALSFDGTEPTKASDGLFSYTFVGWAASTGQTSGTAAASLSAVTDNVTYYAAFTATPITYTVMWKSQDGATTLEEDTGVTYNATPSFDGTTPTKASDGLFSYTFAGWAASTGQTSGTAAASLSAVTDNVTYYAAFTATPITYTVTWKSQDGATTLEEDTGVAYNATPSFDETAPSKANDGLFSYTFVGWAASTGQTSGTAAANLSAVTDNVTYYAAFTATPITYTVTWKSQDGATTLEEDTGVAYNATPSFDETAPSKASDGLFSYTFVGWAASTGQTSGTAAANLSAVTDNVTYYASFSATPIIEPGTLAFSSATYSVAEDGGSVTITVNRTGGYNGIVTVDYTTSNGIAIADSDYTTASGTISFADGETSKTFTVSITDDNTYEGDETVNLALFNPTSGAALETSSASLTILDDEISQHGALSFSSATYSVAEDGGSVTITVNRTGGCDGVVTVDYTTSNGTTIEGSDYTTASGTISFADSETSKTFTVSITDDNTYEGDETVNLTLNNATGEAILGTQHTATLTITDNELPPPSIDPTSRNYDLNTPADVTTAIIWNGASSVTNAVYSISPDTAIYTLDTGDYTTGANDLNIKSSFFEDLSLTAGTALDFVFTFDTGVEAALTVNIVEGFISVASITDMPDTATAGTPLMLTGTVSPDNATNQTIVWTVKDAGTTGATINGGSLSTTEAGTVTLTATIVNGQTASIDYTQDFTITVIAAPQVSSDASLSGLTLSSGTLSPSFSSGTTAYTASVANNTSQMTVTASVYENHASVTVNGTPVASGQASGDINLNVGSNTITVMVTAQDSTTTKTYTLTITRASSSGSSSGSSGGSSTPSTPAETVVNVLVNGKAENAGTATTSKEGGKTVATIAVNETKLEQKLAAEGNNAVVTIPVTTQADVVVGELNGRMVKSMEDKTAVLEVKTETASYSLPAQQLNIEIIAAQLGQNVELKDVKVQIEIAKSPDATVQVVESSERKGEFTLVTPPMDFTVTCGSGDKTVEISSFNIYVERTIAIPDGVDPSKITTGIIVEPDGTVRHVPTRITTIDGKYYAVINSLTNSTYSVVWHPLEFKDAASHWAKEAINDMGSRMVISGVGDGMFEPDRDITRAEFAAIVVRALGLKPGMGSNHFFDVSASEWYCEYIQTASEYGIIAGYDDSKFGPMDKITREQAMTMVARAMKITGLKTGLAEGDINTLLTGFGDSSQAAAYAKESIAACVKTGIISGKNGKLLAPKDEITRAEVAVIVRRLLQKSNLI